MPHRITPQKENEAKRRQLIWLSAASSALIIIMWIFYMEYTFTAASATTNARESNSSVALFKTGLSTIENTIETGLVNSYLYFHTIASEGKTFTIKR